MNSELIKTYHSAGHLRMVRFIHANGEWLSLNYAYMVSVRYTPESGTIEAAFTSHHITLRGLKLAPLADALEAQQVQSAACTEERYQDLSDAAEPMVFEIISVGNI